jgi:hypothetical protein
MKITKNEAKAIALEVHTYLRDHPEVTDKSEKSLPEYIWDKIKDLHNLCPLCETCFDESLVCPECPLETCGKGSHYRSWTSMKSEAERKEYAQFIINKISTWEI